MVNKVGYLFDEFIERFDTKNGEREWGQRFPHALETVRGLIELRG
jgi:hypothetical protein